MPDDWSSDASAPCGGSIAKPLMFDRDRSSIHVVVYAFEKVSPPQSGVLLVGAHLCMDVVTKCRLCNVLECGGVAD